MIQFNIQCGQIVIFYFILQMVVTQQKVRENA